MSFDTRINQIFTWFNNNISSLGTGRPTFEEMKADIIYNISTAKAGNFLLTYYNTRTGEQQTEWMSLFSNFTKLYSHEYTWDGKQYEEGITEGAYHPISKLRFNLIKVKNCLDYFNDTNIPNPYTGGYMTKQQLLETYGEYYCFDFVNNTPPTGANWPGLYIESWDDRHTLEGVCQLKIGDTYIPLANSWTNTQKPDGSYWTSLTGSSRVTAVAGAITGNYDFYNCYYYAIKGGSRITIPDYSAFVTTTSGHNTALFDPDVIDALIEDLSDIGINIQLSSGPEPGPGDAEETAPGQPDNSTHNIGGDGDFSSDGILEQQTGATGTSSYAGTTYALNRAAFRDVKRALWDADYLTLIKNLFGSGQNTIINCLLFPFNISGITSNLIPVTSVYLGTHEVELTSPSAAYAIPSGGVAEVEIGPLTNLGEPLGGFLEDNGVSECYIHLPFIGMQQIDPDIVYNHNIKVKYLFDYMTGECQALIYSNMATEEDGQTYTNQYVLCYEFSGQAGIPIGFSESNLNSLILNVGVNALKGAFQGGAAGAGTAVVEGAMSVIGAPSAHMEGSTGSSIERLKSLDIYLMFIRPKTYYPKNYNKTKGRPSQQDKKLSDCRGFTVVDNPLIETTATDEEREMIVAQLKEGVRIK